ncbi:MAG: porin, partial [Glaciimonas sp.]|nr:porin [Glaciimonas sp.]
MNQKTWLKLSAIGCAIACMSLAQAQTSSVTVYGSIDAGPTYISNVGGAAKTIIDYGGVQPDRIGFRGTEDLGGGLSALFK